MSYVYAIRFDSLYIFVPPNQLTVTTKRLGEPVEMENHPIVYYCTQRKILDGYDV